MRQILLLIFFFFLGLNLFGQVRVRGAVTDKKLKGIKGVHIVFKQDGKVTGDTLTNKNGEYALDLSNGIYQVFFLYGDEIEQKRLIQIPNEPMFVIEPVILNLDYQDLEGVTVNHSRQELNGLDKLPPIDYQKLVFSQPEKLLVLTQAGVNSNNELTSNYNVRGGNYDENLVYVNGFLINRPFLTRSGQQEGMSFINTALVKDVYFSSGGFQAVYGDKLSSVLDIRYKVPDSLRASVMASILGVEAHVENKVGKHERFRYLLGARYRANGYLLNSLPTKGNYNPVYWDTQLLTDYKINEYWSWSVLGHISSNTYKFAPQTSQTDFGTANEAYSFNIYFDGQENTQFLTSTIGTSLNYESKRLSSKTYFTYFRTDEQERFDILGQYYINQLETDPSKEEYGDSVAAIGVGGFLNHARNRLQASIFAVYNDAVYTFSTKNEHAKHNLLFGAGAQMEHFDDVLSEWQLIDSAGYSNVPFQTQTDGVDLYEVIKSQLNMNNTRLWAYAQDHWEWKKIHHNVPVSKEFTSIDSLGKEHVRVVRDTIETSISNLVLDFGVRGIHTSFNQDGLITPRFSLTYYPVKHVYFRNRFYKRYVRYRFSAGMYYQPPFYREYRTFSGQLNQNVKAQKSAHFVLGMDYSFYMWNRQSPFKFTAEAYYKYLWDVNPYEVDNVRTRYFATNDAVAYATGLDLNLNGEFVPGLVSFFKVGLLSTKENLKDDYYYNYYNAEGEKIIFGYSDDQVVVDSARVNPGFIRRPTDQHFTVGVMFQDNMPNLEQLTVQVGITYGSPLPYGPPDHSRYKDTLQMKSYFRVDMGTSYDLLHKKVKGKRTKFNFLESAIVSLEVFNLLGINNVLSKQWVQDVSGKYYAIPNYLTQRRFNLKLIVRI